MRCPLLAFALSLLPAAASGATFSAPLPELVGVIDFTPGSVGREVSFDVGQRFSEIERVSIEIDAQVFAQELDVCGTIFDPQPCVHQVHLLGLVAFMDEQESAAPGFIFTRSGLSFSDDLNVLEASGVARDDFRNLLIGWEFLLDGESSLTLSWNSLFGFPEMIIMNVSPPSGEIFAARIIIEGTPVPEPSTGLLLAVGLLALAGQRTGKPG